MTDPKKPNTESEGGVFDWYHVGYWDAKEGGLNPPEGGRGTPEYDDYERGRSAYLEEAEEEGREQGRLRPPLRVARDWRPHCC